MTYNPKLKKKIFTFNIDNVIDIITNSSSELFVLEAESETIVKEMVSSAHTNYQNEYEEPIKLIDCSAEQMETYVDSVFRNYCDFSSRIKKTDYSMGGIAPELLYANWDQKDKEQYWYPRLSESGIKLFKKAIDPEGKIWLLFSLDENPNWEMQESLMSIATRYHLG